MYHHPKLHIYEPMVIITAPSGSGKSTLIKMIMENYSYLFEFSVSATTRSPKKGEKYGKDYYFLSVEEFMKQRDRGNMAEFEEVYPDKWYGTQVSEIERIHNLGKIPLLDIDVEGAGRLKKWYAEMAAVFFIVPPSVEELEKRLLKRGRESDEEIAVRLERAPFEMAFENYDVKVINENLDFAFNELINAIITYPKVNQFISMNKEKTIIN